ncbi:hypothetical protein LWI29_032802 [Acer saccharum]|uniref:MULE transposase domain-containing protein n=1 Tax=Acer saccharum TaxID=4024 RepID=A0AA39VJL7_ACESA|nr:hypothetical protein LWI29_032802 [Acer saccharum]
MVMLIVNYDGVWEDVDFNPKTIFLLAVTPKDTLKTLSDKICDRFGLNCDAVDMKFSTLLSGTVVQMSFDADFQIFIAHNKKILNVTFRCFTILYRPVVSIDATHLTGSLKGVLLIASAKDGDSKIYPLAFGFAASECKGSWTWFLSELKKGIGSPQDLVIVSDRHRGIISAMNEVFPMRSTHSVSSTLHRNLDGHPRIKVLQDNSFTMHVTNTVAMTVISTFNRWLLATRDEWAVRLCRSVPPYKNICSESDFVNRCCDSLKDLLDVTIEYKKVVERNEARSRSRSTVVESRVAELERDVYRLKNTKSTSLVDRLRRQEGCTLFKNRPSGSRH